MCHRHQLMTCCGCVGDVYHMPRLQMLHCRSGGNCTQRSLKVSRHHLWADLSGSPASTSPVNNHVNSVPHREAADAAGSDAILTRCLWTVGLAITDPGFSALPPGVDPAAFPDAPLHNDDKRVSGLTFPLHVDMKSA